MLPFGIVAYTFCPTTFLEIAVYEQEILQRTITLVQPEISHAKLYFFIIQPVIFNLLEPNLFLF